MDLKHLGSAYALREALNEATARMLHYNDRVRELMNKRCRNEAARRRVLDMTQDDLTSTILEVKDLMERLEAATV